VKDDVHVMPVDDLVAHLDARGCWCVPEIQQVGLCAIVVHHSADGREEDEAELARLIEWHQPRRRMES